MSHGQRHCGSSEPMLLVADGYCQHGQVFASRAWALSPALAGRKGFQSPEYAAWVRAAWSSCLAKNPKTTHVPLVKREGAAL